jgi:hypothetical protein
VTTLAAEYIRTHQRSAIAQQHVRSVMDAHALSMAIKCDPQRATYTALNDVATCYYLQGIAAERLARLADARRAYTVAAQFTYARCSSPSGWRWSPSRAAAEQLRTLTLSGDCVQADRRTPEVP